MKYPLTVQDATSDKETIHAEFDLNGSELAYTSGDALGVYPMNNPPEVDTVLHALHCKGDEMVPVPSFCYLPKPEDELIPLKSALTRYYDLKTVKLDMMKLLVQSATKDSEKERGEILLSNGVCLIVPSHVRQHYYVVEVLNKHMCSVNVSHVHVSNTVRNGLSF